MLRTDLADDLWDRLGDDWALWPDYGGYCFAQLPHTVADLFDVDTGQPLPADVLDGVDTDVSTVLVVVVDSFGFDLWRRDHDDHPFLRAVTDHGCVTPVTSIYPSETAAAITTFHTGATAAEHGSLAWNVYDSDDDQAFEALTGRVKGGVGAPDPDRQEGQREDTAGDSTTVRDPMDSFEADPIYPTLRDAGVDCRHVVPFAETYPGATAHTYDAGDLSTFGPTLVDALDGGDDPAYVYAYLPQVDHAAHAHGVDGQGFHDALTEVCETLEAALFDLDPGLAEDTLLVVTADHGHANVESRVDLDGVDGLTDALQRHGDGSPVRLSGSPRNVHLHLRDGTDEATRETLADAVDGRVFTRAEALEQGLFGDDPSAAFERRLGDLVVTPREGLAWFGDVEPDELDLQGMHGGLSGAEMLTQVAVAPLDDLSDA